MRQASAAMLMMPEVKSASTVSTSPEKRAATSPGFCPASVPAGKYAKAALTALGVWSSVATKVAPAENVRAAMALVERGAAPLGIVYATDARASKSVRIVGTFPATSHPPIRYPVALLKASRHKDAAGFRAFLLSKQGRTIFARHGFSAP